MKLLCSTLFLSCIFFCAHSQQLSSDTCSVDENFYRVRIRKEYQQQFPNIQFPVRSLKKFEYCIVSNLLDLNEEIVYVLDIRHEVKVYPNPANE